MAADVASASTHDAIGRVLGRTPSGIFIVTAGDGNGQMTGMLASWVQQASFDPPMITVAVNGQRYLNEWLSRSPKLVVNLVADGQGHLLKHFGRGFEPDQNAFEGIATAVGLHGLPVLSDALGYMEGEVAGSLAAGDHVVYLVKVVAAGASSSVDELKPMVHIRRNGLRY